MDELSPAIVGMMIPIVAILGAILVVIVGMMNKARLRELEIKERIAMIERGMVPAPESDPRGFDRAITRLEQVQRVRQLQGHGASRHRRAGITLMGVGFGMMVLMSFTGEGPSTGLGVGGFLVVMGLAFFVNAWFESRDAQITAIRPPATQPTSTDTHPPQN